MKWQNYLFCDFPAPVSRNPFAKGLWSILSWVIWIEELEKKSGLDERWKNDQDWFSERGVNLSQPANLNKIPYKTVTIKVLEPKMSSVYWCLNTSLCRLLLQVSYIFRSLRILQYICNQLNVITFWEGTFDQINANGFSLFSGSQIVNKANIKTSNNGGCLYLVILIW